ncbi:MAG: RNA-binding domain-containing protein [Halobacteriales archaeon]|nr:RNA-binding domain-containing protein [Halobacteriales archaeon]
MIFSVDVRAETPVNETELPDRVERAVRTVFPDADVTVEEGLLVAETHDLAHFSELLHEQEILDTARNAFEVDESGFSFRLKKAAAFEGRVNFAVGSPGELGVIDVRVDVREPSVEQYIDHVIPSTEEGEPV